MSDLHKLGRKLIKENIPELIPTFWGLSAKLSTLIFALRVNKGMSQDDLAKALEVEPKIIHKLEGGSKDISIEIYEKALVALGLSYEEIDKLITFEKE